MEIPSYERIDDEVRDCYKIGSKNKQESTVSNEKNNMVEKELESRKRGAKGSTVNGKGIEIGSVVKNDKCGMVVKSGGKRKDDLHAKGVKSNSVESNETSLKKDSGVKVQREVGKRKCLQVISSRSDRVNSNQFKRFHSDFGMRKNNIYDHNKNSKWNGDRNVVERNNNGNNCDRRNYDRNWGNANQNDYNKNVCDRYGNGLFRNDQYGGYDRRDNENGCGRLNGFNY